jgi:hypothetical protein
MPIDSFVQFWHRFRHAIRHLESKICDNSFIIARTRSGPVAIDSSLNFTWDMNLFISVVQRTADQPVPQYRMPSRENCGISGTVGRIGVKPVAIDSACLFLWEKTVCEVPYRNSKYRSATPPRRYIAVTFFLFVGSRWDRRQWTRENILRRIDIFTRPVWTILIFRPFGTGMRRFLPDARACVEPS